MKINKLFLLILFLNIQIGTFKLQSWPKLPSFDSNTIINDAKKKIDSKFDSAIAAYKKSITDKADARAFTASFSQELSQNEQVSISARNAITKNAFKAFTQTDSEKKVAFCGSGGGYRAMIYTLGALKAAQKLGLLECASYMSALSGSTWALNAWLLSGQSISEIADQISKKIAQNRQVNQLGTPLPKHLEDIPEKELNPMVNNFVVKSIFNQPLTSVDFWGAIIINNLLGRQTDLLSQLQEKTKSGQHIFALNTAANPKEGEKFNYDWYEVTPFDVRNLSNNMHVEIEGFGRKFENNSSLNLAPELPAGFYLGTFGSAFTVSPQEYENMSNLIDNTNQAIKNKIREIFAIQSILDGIPKVPGFDKERTKVINALNDYRDQKIDNFNLIKKQDFENLPQNVTGARFLPAKVDNPVGDDPLTLVDAGIAINLPIKPLLHPGRNINVIFVFDASETIKGSPELNKAIEQHKLKYDKIDIINDSLHIYTDTTNQAPTIIYIPMAKIDYDPQLLKQHGFTAEEIQNVKNTDFEYEVSNGFCSTFNFQYTQDQFNILFNLAQFNLISNIDKIKDVLVN